MLTKRVLVSEILEGRAVKGKVRMGKVFTNMLLMGKMARRVMFQGRVHMMNLLLFIPLHVDFPIIELLVILPMNNMTPSEGFLITSMSRQLRATNVRGQNLQNPGNHDTCSSSRVLVTRRQLHVPTKSV